VGIDFPSGGTITFTAKTDLIPAGSQVILEDRLTNTFTNLVGNASGYAVNLPVSSTGTGRFFLHTGSNTVDNPLEKENPLEVYAFGKKIHIKGEVSENTLLSLYSVHGVLVRQYTPEASVYRQLNAEGLTDGVYVLTLKSKERYEVFKLFIGSGK